jgi:hypothetical protein
MDDRYGNSGHADTARTINCRVIFAGGHCCEVSGNIHDMEVLSFILIFLVFAAIIDMHLVGARRIANRVRYPPSRAHYPLSFVWIFVLSIGTLLLWWIIALWVFVTFFLDCCFVDGTLTSDTPIERFFWWTLGLPLDLGSALADALHGARSDWFWSIIAQAIVMLFLFALGSIPVVVARRRERPPP